MIRPLLTVIVPDGDGSGYLAEAWSRRRLLWFFARRDLVVRYRQTVLGILWVLLRPALATGVFTIVFGKVAGLAGKTLDGSGAVLPYPVIVLTGMLGWNYFANCMGEGSHVLVNNPSLITKIWFPRLLLPLASLVLNLVDLAVGLVFLALVMAWYGVMPAWSAPLAVLPLAVLAGFALGCALWTGALMVRFRDVRAIVPVLLTYGFLFAPVAFTAHAAPESWQAWLWANPMAAAVESFRACLIGTPMPPLWACCWSAGCSIVLLATGYRFFRHWERVFADVL
jgi:lipopolysaccharide transport system permease protein